jgi:hypothetical protein
MSDRGIIQIWDENVAEGFVWPHQHEPYLVVVATLLASAVYGTMASPTKRRSAASLARQHTVA